ncbi:MAG: hypothetical protein ACE5KW_02270 [Dehalococcoidia bacterium]
MSELERSHRLARAIDDLLQGKEPELDDEELTELLEIARLRYQAARNAAGMAQKYQDFVWARLEARIMRILDERGQKPEGMAGEKGGGPIAAAIPGMDDLREVMGGRHGLIQEMATMTEAYRDVVWERVQSRIKARGAKKGRRFFPFLRSSRQTEHEEADRLAKAIDAMILGEPVWEVADSRLNDLLRLARLRRAWGNAVATSTAPYQDRIWRRLRPRLAFRPGKTHAPKLAGAWRRGAVWPRLAAIAAGLALFASAVGPLPATGLADHPFSQLIDFVGDKAGVTETGAALPATPIDSSGDA